jgi:hypothetical protein
MTQGIKIKTYCSAAFRIIPLKDRSAMGKVSTDIEEGGKVDTPTMRREFPTDSIDRREGKLETTLLEGGVDLMGV